MGCAPEDRASRRARLASHLHGSGVDLGPGHLPFELPPGAVVQYVDRWKPEEQVDIFPELSGGNFPRPDIVADFDTDRLGPLPDTSQDFVVCSHVLEHLADPIGMLGEIHRVLRPGGSTLIMLPDRRQTFDRDRDPTTLDHLVAEHESGTSRVSDEHVYEFLTRAGPEAAYLDLPSDRAEWPAFFEWHRRRSIHVHCWGDDEFLPVLLYGITYLNHRWELVDRLEAAPDGDEFGFVLRRARLPLPRQWGRRRFTRAWERLGA